MVAPTSCLTSCPTRRVQIFSPDVVHMMGALVPPKKSTRTHTHSFEWFRQNLWASNSESVFPGLFYRHIYCSSISMSCAARCSYRRDKKKLGGSSELGEAGDYRYLSVNGLRVCLYYFLNSFCMPLWFLSNTYILCCGVSNSVKKDDMDIIRISARTLRMQKLVLWNLLLLKTWAPW